MAEKKTTKEVIKEETKVVDKEIKETKKAEEVKPKYSSTDLVPFRAFKDNDKYKDDIYVGVNGKRYKIPRGVEVMIPRNVYNILMRSMKQDQDTADLMNRESQDFINQSKFWSNF